MFAATLLLKDLTHTSIIETLKRVYSPNNFKFMLLKNVFVWFLFHVLFHKFLPLTKATKPSK
jgi:hypothetical protein